MWSRLLDSSHLMSLQQHRLLATALSIVSTCVRGDRESPVSCLGQLVGTKLGADLESGCGEQEQNQNFPPLNHSGK